MQGKLVPLGSKASCPMCGREGTQSKGTVGTRFGGQQIVFSCKLCRIDFDAWLRGEKGKYQYGIPEIQIDRPSETHGPVDECRSGYD